MKITLLATLILLVSCSSNKENASKEVTSTNEMSSKAISDIHSSSMKKLQGNITIEELDKVLKISANLKGLRPNSKHGFHVHQKGVCEGPDYKSAGDHYNPDAMKHGKPGTEHHHKGDLGNLVTNANGEINQVIMLPKSELNNIESWTGKSLLIHAKADDFKSQPSGDSGARIACGLIKPL
jgi:superoxide dismutase, Cu-Zn family